VAGLAGPDEQPHVRSDHASEEPMRELPSPSPDHPRGHSSLSRLTYALVLVGALALLVVSAGYATKLAFRGSPTGVVHGPNDEPLAGVPVFLDRGEGAIERYTTDSAGAFALPLERDQWRAAVWLICAPGGTPMVGRGDERSMGPINYGSNALPGATFGFYRASGWRRPIPPECPPDDRAPMRGSP
jgi:hypothetical protein